MGYFNLPTLYLFDNVFFPNTIVPLNIFDAPSKNLIMHCYEHNEPLALWFQGEHVKPIASMGKILSVEKKDDGNLKVLLQGIGRVNLEKIIQHIPYPIYRAKFFQDAEAPPFQNHDRLEKFYHYLEDWLRLHVPSKRDRTEFLKDINTPDKLVDHVALLILRDSEIKQILLESNSLQDRLQLLDTLIKSPFEKEDHLAKVAIKKFERLGRVAGDPPWENH